MAERSTPSSDRLNAGRLLAALGAMLLFVSLFLDWYEPGLSAWTVFEVVDLLLAVIALTVVLTVAFELARRPLGLDGERWLPILAAAALLLVVVSIVNNPPAVNGRGEDVGAWIALTGAILMGAGALLGQRRIAIVVSAAPRGNARTPAGNLDTEPRGPTGPATEPAGSETETRPINPVGRG